MQLLYLQITLLNIEIGHYKSYRGHIQLHYSCYALSLIQPLAWSKSALKLAVCTELKLKVSEPETCRPFISKIYYCTSKSPQKQSCRFYIFLQLLIQAYILIQSWTPPKIALNRSGSDKSQNSSVNLPKSVTFAFNYLENSSQNFRIYEHQSRIGNIHTHFSCFTLSLICS